MGLFDILTETAERAVEKARQVLDSPPPNPLLGTDGDIVLLIDRSPSMEAQDMPPSRLAVAIDCAREFNEARAVSFPNTRLSLLLFAATASKAVVGRQAGQDFDRALVRYGKVYPEYSTNFIVALTSGVSTMTGAARNRKIILLTDGDHNYGGSEHEVIEVAEYIQNKGVLIEAIGIGQRGEVNEDLLLEMVSTVNGKKLYRWIGDNPEELVRHYGIMASER